MDSSLAVSCSNLTKTYHADGADTYALRGVSLSVRRGELLMLVGPSGCGKTTLISVIAGILRQDGGECSVYGENFSALPDSVRTKLRGKLLGFVFQSYNLMPKLIVCDEPTSALDQDTGQTIMHLFREVALAEDRSLIIVTHDNRIFSYADRIATMNDGMILDEKATS